MGTRVRFFGAISAPDARKEVVIQLTRLFKADDTNLIFYKSFLPKVIDVCYQVLVREKKSASVRNKVFQLLFETCAIYV